MKFGDKMYMNERTLKEFNVYKFMILNSFRVLFKELYAIYYEVQT